MAATKTAKEVQIIATYYHKSNGKLNGTVSYLVRSSDGKSQYCTTLIEGKASGCSCPARGNCYHKKQLEQKAQERKEVAQQFSASSVPTWTMQLVTAGKLVAPKAKVVTLPHVEPKVTDISTKGNFGSRAFTILKSAS